MPAMPAMPASLSIRAAALAAVALLAAAPLAAQRATAARGADWCGEWNDRDRATHCEERELTLDARRTLRVDGRANGGVRVTGWDRDEIRVVARLQARADTRRDAEAIVDAIRIADGDVLRADGPTRLARDEHWSVSYEIRVPHRTDLELRAQNGGLAVTDVDGRLSLRTVNGGLHLVDVAGDVQGRTTNGGITAELSGSRWQGEGLDVQTTNGGVRLRLPRDYSATLETGTVNGGFSIDFPITVQGRLDRRHLRTELGRGGALVRATTTNGGVVVSRR